METWLLACVLQTKRAIWAMKPATAGAPPHRRRTIARGASAKAACGVRPMVVRATRCLPGPPRSASRRLQMMYRMKTARTFAACLPKRRTVRCASAARAAFVTIPAPRPLRTMVTKRRANHGARRTTSASTVSGASARGARFARRDLRARPTCRTTPASQCASRFATQASRPRTAGCANAAVVTFALRRAWRAPVQLASSPSQPATRASRAMSAWKRARRSVTLAARTRTAPFASAAGATFAAAALSIPRTAASRSAKSGAMKTRLHRTAAGARARPASSAALGARRARAST